MILTRSTWLTVTILLVATEIVAVAEEPIVVGRGGFPSLRAEATASPHQRRQPVPDDRIATPSDFAASQFKSFGPVVTVTSSLAIVLALFAGVVGIGRKFGGGKAGSKPVRAEALALLGHLNVDPRTKLILVRCGRRVLVLSQSASGLTPVSEISDPDEARELMAHCSPESRNAFSQTLNEMQRERHPAGFTDAVAKPASRRLFATA